MNRPHRIMRLETWPRLYLLPLAKLYCSSRLLCSSAATGVGTYLQFPHRSASTGGRWKKTLKAPAADHDSEIQKPRHSKFMEQDRRSILSRNGRQSNFTIKLIHQDGISLALGEDGSVHQQAKVPYGRLHGTNVGPALLVQQVGVRPRPVMQKKHGLFEAIMPTLSSVQGQALHHCGHRGRIWLRRKPLRRQDCIIRSCGELRSGKQAAKDSASQPMPLSDNCVARRLHGLKHGLQVPHPIRGMRPTSHEGNQAIGLGFLSQHQCGHDDPGAKKGHGKSQTMKAIRTYETTWSICVNQKSNPNLYCTVLMNKCQCLRLATHDNCAQRKKELQRTGTYRATARRKSEPVNRLL